MVEPRKLFGGLGNRLFQMAYLFSKTEKGEIPDIYVQDEKYFSNVKNYVRNLFGTNIIRNDYVSLHVRRGDYTDNPYYVDLCETDYYDRAMDMFPGEKFLIFCHDGQDDEKDVRDREWCMDWAEARGINYEINYPGTEVDDFNKMAGCKAHICANSTFSWWASYVGGGKTIAPKEYYSDGVQRTMWPKEFTII